MSIGKQILVMVLVAIGLTVWLNDRYDWSKNPPKGFAELAAEKETTVQSTPDFLAICSGMTITPQTEASAIANCMGHVGGFVAGYETTITFVNAEGHQMYHKPLWCKEEPVTVGHLYGVVARWAAAHPDRVAAQVEMYGARNPTATQTVIIAAMNATYPCK